MSPRGGFRSGAGRKPRAFSVVRLGMQIEKDLLDKLDAARRGWVSRAAFLRLGLDMLVEDLEADPSRAFTPPEVNGGKAAFPLEVPGELFSRAQSLVESGRADSLVDLVRGAGRLVVERMR